MSAASLLFMQIERERREREERDRKQRDEEERTMGIRRRATENHTYQNKLSTEPPGLCKNDQKHGPQANGRKDGLCENCGHFADKAARGGKA